MSISPRTMLRAVAATAALALTLVALGCVTNPATGRRQVIFVSEQQEIQMGIQADPGIKAEYGVYENAELAAWLDGIGTKLAKTSDRPDLPYKFTLLDSSVVNAFALPGGPVYATRGLIAYANDEAELAGVVGHEIGHVIGRHGAEQVSKGQLLQIGVVGASIASEKIGQYAQMLGQGAQLLMLKYGRDAEREADSLGVRYLTRAQYDPYGVSRYMDVLDRLSASRGQVLPTWLSTHPNPGDRAQKTRALAVPAHQQMVSQGIQPYRGQTEFLRRLDGLVFGDDPRQGFVEGNTFHHPELRFRYDIPEGWVTQNTRQFVASVDNPQQPSAQLMLRLVTDEKGRSMAPDAYASYVQQNNQNIVLRGSRTTINGFPAWMGQVAQAGTANAQPAAMIGWIRSGDLMYELVGAWAQNPQSQTISSLERSIRSFRTENDPSILSRKPDVLRLVRSRGGNLNSLCRTQPQLAIGCSEIAMLNRIDPNGPLPNRSIKVPTKVR